MAKGRKKTKGLQSGIGGPSPYKEPTAQEKCERAAEHLLREAVEADPKFKSVAKSIATHVRRGASKLVRAAKGSRGE